MTAEHQRRLVDLHPDCAVQIFPTGGHSLLLTRPLDYLAQVRDHLRVAAEGAA